MEWSVTCECVVNDVRLGVLCVSPSDSCRGVVLSSHSVLPVPLVSCYVCTSVCYSSSLFLASSLLSDSL